MLHAALPPDPYYIHDPKAPVAEAEEEEEEEEEKPAPKPKHPLEALGKPTFVLDDW